MRFTGKRYITRNAAETLPNELQILFWEMIGDIRPYCELDYLQIFRLSSSLDATTQQPVQKVIHEQEQPPYQKTHYIPIENTIEGKIYIIDSGPYSTLMLAEEY